MHYKGDATQCISTIAPDGSLAMLELPRAGAGVPGLPLRWGEAIVPTTPAYWAAQTWMWSLDAPDHYRLGRSLEEELLACMLGGHGIPAEVGLAAYHRLRAAMHERPEVLCDRARVHAMLSRPLDLDGRSVRYRFANQKAGYVAAAFARIEDVDPTSDDRTLRDALTSLKGVGPKTASWVLRNLRGSDQVAILDVHILRAGWMLGLFDGDHRVERNYREMEYAYLGFADAISARASILDSVIWMTMRQLPTPRTLTTSRHTRGTTPSQDQQSLPF